MRLRVPVFNHWKHSLAQGVQERNPGSFRLKKTNDGGNHLYSLPMHCMN
nr:MAG TPA: hypothetical protein [Caudoviricetes sp.]